MSKLQDFCNQHWYELKTEIDWDWDRYKNWIPSVTTILWVIHDPWFSYVLKNFKEKVQEAADRWTIVHSNAELYFKKDSWIKEMNPMFTKLHTLLNIEILNTEERYTRDWISWTIDLIGKVNYGEHVWVYNIDYKNTDKHSPKYAVQLWGYEYLNGNKWIIAYWKTKLKVIFVEEYYKDIFIEAKDLFSYLHKKTIN